MPVDQRSTLALEMSGGSATVKDILIIEMFKSMGLSDKVLAMIEEDLKLAHVYSGAAPQPNKELVE